MLITRKKSVPLHWAFYAELPVVFAVWTGFLTNAPFLLAIKKFVDNPAVIMGLISIEVYLTMLGGPLVAWISDRIWTRFGRRKIFGVIGYLAQATVLFLIPFAPDLWTLIVLRWLFGAAQDITTPVWPMVMETIPPPQRGRATGFRTVALQVLNAITWFLVIGRFHDVYVDEGFMSGIFNFTGVGLMFWLGAFLYLANAAYVGLAYKEIKPPKRRTFADDRKPGETTLKAFFRLFFKDIFSKSLLPFYLLLLTGAMFGLSLGIFAPLVYTEQWGYSLQQMGTNVAIGASINIFIALLAGWIADKTNKMRVYVYALSASLVIKLIWMAYVFNKPEYRPELWEIIVFGEIGTVFAMIATTVASPLMYEFVERNRMGTATAGMQLFNTLVKNTMSFLVGLWLWFWSWLFLPSEGVFVEMTFQQPVDQATIEQQLADAPFEVERLAMDPLHAPGIGDPESARWKIRLQDEETGELIERSKDIRAEIDRWAASRDSILTGEEKAARLQEQIDAAREDLLAVEAELEERTEAFRSEISEALQPIAREEGSEILSARFADGELELELRTLEEVTEEQEDLLEKGLRSGAFALDRVEKEDGGVEYVPAIEVESGQSEGGEPMLYLDLRYDENFLLLYRSLRQADVPAGRGYRLSLTLTELIRSVIGRNDGISALSDVSVGSSDGVLSLSLDFGPDPGPSEELRAALREAIDAEIDLTALGGEGELRFAIEDEADGAGGGQLSGDQDLLANAMEGASAVQVELAADTYSKVIAAAAARPIFVTVPRPVINASYAEREYEYFFSVHTLMVLTDVVGLLCVGIIAVLERRGVVHRRGLEEEEAR